MSLRLRTRLPAGFIVPCQPSPAPRPPVAGNWIHEIKHDGYRLMVRKEEDVRGEQIEARKERLSELVRIVTRDKPGIAISDHIEGDAAAIFKHACKLRLEGIVSKRKGSRYKSGPSPDWIKSKNPESAAVIREASEDWNR